MKKRLIFKKVGLVPKEILVADNACGGGSNACK